VGEQAALGPYSPRRGHRSGGRDCGVTFVNGINGYVAEKILNLGADAFIMCKVSPATTNIDHYLEAMKRKDLNMDDYRAVREGCKLCSYVGAYAFKLTGHVKYGEKSLSDTMVWG